MTVPTDRSNAEFLASLERDLWKKTSPNNRRYSIAFSIITSTTTTTASQDETDASPQRVPASTRSESLEQQSEDLEIVQALAAVVLGEDGESTENNNSSIQKTNSQLTTGEENHHPTTSTKPETGDPLAWSPLDPDELDLLKRRSENPPEYLFTNEELAEALKHIGEETAATEQASYPEDEPPTQLLDESGQPDLLLEELPDFEILGTDDDNEQLLVGLNDLDQIFDEEEIPNQPSESAQETTDPETDEILQQLQGLSLDLPPDNHHDEDEDSYNPPLEEGFAVTPFQFSNGGISPLFYCRPCVDPLENTEPDDFYSLSLENALLDEETGKYSTDLDNLFRDLNLDADIAQEKEEQEQAMEQENDELLRRSRQVISSSVMAAAATILHTFRAKPIAPDTKVPEVPLPNASFQENIARRSCLGHRERILSVQFSPCGNYLGTASADSTIRVWRPSNNQLLCTLRHHNDKYECLRVAWGSSQWLDPNASDNEPPLLATAGADGQVFLLQQKAAGKTREDWQVMACIDHADGLRHFTSSDPEDKPQIYALQFIHNWQVNPGHGHCGNRFLLTSSENHIHLFELVQEPRATVDTKLSTVEECDEQDEEEDSQKSENDEDPKEVYPWHFKEVFSIGFGDLHSAGYGVSVGRVTEEGNAVLPFTNPTNGDGSSAAFGGDRNPDGVIFVFDASYNPINGMLGVALSDGSLRLLNGRGECMSVLQLPGVTAHLTSFCWDATGTQLATSVANTGHVITWEILLNASRTDVQKTSCRAVLGGGHDRTVFGTRYIGSSSPDESDPLLLSWGVDGRIALWDAQALDELDAPIATLQNDPEYPIFNLDYHADSRRIAVVGGAGDGGFIGIPTYIYDLGRSEEPKAMAPRSKQTDDEPAEETKKTKISLDDDCKPKAANPRTNDESYEEAKDDSKKQKTTRTTSSNDD